MPSSRRRFLSYGLAVPPLLWGCRTAGRASTTPPDSASATPPKPAAPGPIKSLLVLGGTRFLGPAVVDEALAAGLEVTLFNRGKSNPQLYPQLEKLVGDRDPDKDDGLTALSGRKWDAVIDTSGYFPRHVRASAELLAPSVGQYVFISSISAYASHDHPGDDETAPLAQLDDPTVETMGDQFQNYGGLKVLCEQAAEAAMPGRVSTVRPGYIVGPLDPTDRFTYWPVRVARGGPMLAPGSPDDPIQVIDVRDLGRWLIKLCTTRTAGLFNAVGPDKPMRWGDVLQACKEASQSDTTLVWAPTEFLQKLAEEAEAEGAGPPPLPIWAPPSGETAGFHQYSNARAVEAGLTFRSIEETTADTLEWFRSLPQDRQAAMQWGLPPQLEKEVLAKLAKQAQATMQPPSGPSSGGSWRWGAPSRTLASAFG